MGEPNDHRWNARAGGVAAIVAVLAFVIVVLHEAFQFAHSVSEALLNTGEIFRRAIPLGTLIAGALSAVLVGGLVWFHIDAFKNCWKNVLEQLKNNLLLLRNLIGAISVVAPLILLIVFLPPRVEQPYKATPLVEDPPNESQKAAPPPVQQSAPKSTPAPSTPQPRMAGRDVCDLFDDPTDSELNNCMRDILKHPGRRGTGGPNCVLIKNGRRSHIQCWSWPPPLPRPRPTDLN